MSRRRHGRTTNVSRVGLMETSLSGSRTNKVEGESGCRAGICSRLTLWQVTTRITDESRILSDSGKRLLRLGDNSNNWCQSTDLRHGQPPKFTRPPCPDSFCLLSLFVLFALHVWMFNGKAPAVHVSQSAPQLFKPKHVFGIEALCREVEPTRYPDSHIW